jgi:hypothetical protein
MMTYLCAESDRMLAATGHTKIWMVRSKSSPMSDEREEIRLHPGQACLGRSTSKIKLLWVILVPGTDVSIRWGRVCRSTKSSDASFHTMAGT